MTSSDYNSLQIGVRRNMTRHLSYGLAYNLQQDHGLRSGNGGNGSVGGHDSASSRISSATGGPSSLPTPQSVVVNYVYEAPNLGQKLNFKPLGWVTDHWTWSGITQIRGDSMTGVPGHHVISNSNAHQRSLGELDWLARKAPGCS